MTTDATPLSGASYAIDAGLSRFTVRAFATGLLAAFGHSPTIAIRDFSGTVVLAGEDPASAHVRVVVNAGALVVVDNVNDRDRRDIERSLREEVLEVTKHPTITFTSRAVTVSGAQAGRVRATIFGTLSCHGVERSERIDADVTLGPDRLTAAGTFSIRQSDYAIRPVSAAGGAVKLKDELTFAFHVAAKRWS